MEFPGGDEVLDADLELLVVEEDAHDPGGATSFLPPSECPSLNAKRHPLPSTRRHRAGAAAASHLTEINLRVRDAKVVKAWLTGSGAGVER